MLPFQYIFLNKSMNGSSSVCSRYTMTRVSEVVIDQNPAIQVVIVHQVPKARIAVLKVQIATPKEGMSYVERIFSASINNEEV